jgi:hypothetical protein
VTRCGRGLLVDKKITKPYIKKKSDMSALWLWASLCLRWCGQQETQEHTGQSQAHGPCSAAPVRIPTTPARIPTTPSPDWRKWSEQSARDRAHAPAAAALLPILLLARPLESLASATFRCPRVPIRPSACLPTTPTIRKLTYLFSNFWPSWEKTVNPSKNI